MSPYPTSTRRSRSTATPSACRSPTRRPTRSRASARRWSPSATPARSSSCWPRLSPESTIAKFLDRSGPGIQQMAYRVTDVEQVSAILRERGLRLLYDEPRRGTSDSRINFVHPKDAGGMPGRAGRTRRPALRRLSHPVPPGVTGRYLRAASPIDPPPPRRTTETTRAEHPRCHPRRRHLGRGLRRPRPARELPGRHRPQGRGRHVRGPRGPGQGPPQVPARRGRRAARARPRRGLRRGDGLGDQLQHRLDLDLRAGVDLQLPGALRADVAAVQAARPALPRGRLGPVRRRAEDRRRRALLAPRRRGRRALPLGRAGEPRRPQRHDARPRAADLGLRDQLRRPGPHRAGQVQPADAEGRPT